MKSILHLIILVGCAASPLTAFTQSPVLLTTVPNPTPGAGDRFAWAVAALGNDRVIIGATYDDFGATDVGTAYLFSVPPAPAIPSVPSLTIRRTTPNTIAVSWPSTATGFVLQQNTNGIATVNWSNVTARIQNDGTSKTLVVNPTGENRFDRLAGP